MAVPVKLWHLSLNYSYNTNNPVLHKNVLEEAIKKIKLAKSWVCTVTDGKLVENAAASDPGRVVTTVFLWFLFQENTSPAWKNTDKLWLFNLRYLLDRFFLKWTKCASLFVRKIKRQCVFVANGEIWAQKKLVLKNNYLIQYIIYLKDSWWELWYCQKKCVNP